MATKLLSGRRLTGENKHEHGLNERNHPRDVPKNTLTWPLARSVTADEFTHKA
jgi:hypothetical protein